MHIQKRKLADGTFRYYIRYWENGKNKTIPQNVTGKFYTRQDAEYWLKTRRAQKERNTIKKYMRAKERYEWRTKYPDLQRTLDLFIKYHEEKAPNSYENTRSYLERFVFRFFSGVKGIHNLRFWYAHNLEFRDWLQTEGRRKDGKNISYSTMNHCICALNLFMRFCVKKQLIDETDYKPCEVFPQSKVDETGRGLEDIIDEEEYKKLRLKLDKARDFFTVLYNTGMRFNELYSLPFCNVFPGHDKLDPMITEKFAEKGKTVYGYIVLKDQLKNKKVNRSEAPPLERKALKSKKTKNAKDWRIIPIVDPDTWMILVKRYNQTSDEFHTRVHKSDYEEDYLLFDDVNYNKLNRELRKYTHKGFHACRHSRATYMVKTLGIALTRLILGHSSMKAFNKYYHLNEEIANKAAMKERPRKLELLEIATVKVG